MPRTPTSTVHVLNETDPLKVLMLWGEPGCEALLGQLLPKPKSLFLSYYEVPQARQEFRRMQALIESEGVQVVRAKDAFVESLGKHPIPDLPANLGELEARLLQKADEYFETYHQAKVGELMVDGAGTIVEEVYFEVKSDMRRVLQEDAERYGEAAAIKFNYLLCLAQALPVSNIFYSRDQSSALGERILLSSLRWSIRKPEVQMYRRALLELGYDHALTDGHDGTIEGGDIILFGDTCYIGVGARTSLSAAKSVCRKLGPDLASRGIQLVAVVNERHERESVYLSAPTEEHMRIMHLDMFWIPLGPGLAMAYSPEVDSRRALRLALNGEEVISEDLGGFRGFLAGKGIQLIEVTAREQGDYATNLLNLGNRRLIVSLSRNERITAELERRGYRVLQAELNKLVGGYGAIHCLSAPLYRQNGAA